MGFLLLIIFISIVSNLVNTLTISSNISIISQDFISTINDAKLEKQSLKFDCHSNRVGCGVFFKNLNLTDKKLMEIKVKLRNSELFDDLNNGLGIW
jgi:hypothetical protein